MKLRIREADGVRYGEVTQLAVAPSHQGRGLGSRLMEIAENRTKELGVSRARLDTAIPAKHLTAWYVARDYRAIAEMQRDGKSYRSVVLEKRL